MYLIRNRSRTLGIADYMDEAKDFAERLSGRAALAHWTYRGELLLDGIPSGWRVLRYVDVPEPE